ncbi:MAG: DUF3822 family protein [Bacteroidales bacterium]|nr:DUF3822 family protein [Bacteroidales bacterium]
MLLTITQVTGNNMPVLVANQPELGKTTEKRLSIQADLNGFSFSVIEESRKKVLYLFKSDFNWDKGHTDIFLRHVDNCIKSQPMLKKQYSSVDIIYDTHKYVLIPRQLYKKGEELQYLTKLYTLDDLEEIDIVEVASEEIVIIFAVNSTLLQMIREVQPSFRIFPAIYPVMVHSSDFSEINKIFFKYNKGETSIIIYEDKRLAFCNNFQAQHFNTALYYLFLALKQVQFNPEQTTVFISGSMPESEISNITKYFSKVRYFRNVAIPLQDANFEMQLALLTFSL